MKTVGEILKNARIKQNFTVLQVASAIKAKEKFITAIENNNFSIFPADVYALGYVRDYAEFIGLNPDEVTPFFRRTIEVSRQKGMHQEKNNFAKEKNFLDLTIDDVGKNISKTILSIGTMIIIIVFVGFLVFEYQRNILHPKLIIDAPPNDFKVSEKTIKVKGKTDSDNKIFINGEETVVSENGSFEKTISLEVGINKIVIKAVNNYQKLTEEERFVFRKK